jgi:dihydropteroate synthase
MKPIVIGIVNATPDSFYDGGKYDDIFFHTQNLIDKGADWIDVGGESTRPGADNVSEKEELRRVIPIIEEFSASIPISIDTTKVNVAKEAFRAGATILNDVQGLQNPDMQQISSLFEKTIIMHSRGTPKNMKNHNQYNNLVEDIADWFIQQAHLCKSEEVWLDPGIGFAKDAIQSVTLLKNTSRFSSLGYPILIGASRKSFIGDILNKPKTQDRLAGSLAAVAAGFYAGASAFRVHDVEETRDIVDFLEIINNVK